MGIADHQFRASQPAGFQAAQKVHPKGFRLGRSKAQANDFTLPVGVGRDSYYSMLGWPDGFCEALRVIRFDHRDTGGSTTIPPGEAGYTVEDMASDIVAVIEAYGLEAANLVGMSLGGLLSQIVAVDHPERVSSPTLIASEPLGWDGEPLPPSVSS